MQKIKIKSALKQLICAICRKSNAILKFVKKLLPEITDITTIALCIWCFSIFGIKRFDMIQKIMIKSGHYLLINFIDLYKYDHPKAHGKSGRNFNSRRRRLHSISRILNSFGLIHPIKYNKYNEYKSNVSFLLKELYLNLDELDEVQFHMHQMEIIMYGNI